jgi:hypothetical protein
MIAMPLRFAGIFALLVALMSGGAHAEKPAKIPVAFGKWTGPHASTFKSALRNGVRKGCAVVRADKARVVIEGEVSADDKPIKLRVVLKSPRSGDIVESREYTFSKPTVSAAQSKRMGREVTEMAQRAPE